MKLARMIFAVGLAGVIGFMPDVGEAASKATDKSRRLDPQTVMQVSRDAIGRKVGDHRLVDAFTGRSFMLSELFGKPIVVNLIYTSCSTVCPVATQHLRDAVEQANAVLGPDRFTVLTVGFDAREDTPRRMEQYAADQDIVLENWRVASASGRTIETLLAELGFSYAAAAGGFDHIAQTTIIDGDGIVYRQVYGDEFPIQMLMEPLKEAVYGWQRPLSVSGLIDRFRYFCTSYDPTTGRYVTRYTSTIGGIVFGGLSLAAFAWVLVREWFKKRPA
ncbi:MAG TPA: SCO family protein [Thiotrichales bacterium]|nr:SCO family protein [Thiotrichales bacterium]